MTFDPSFPDIAKVTRKFSNILSDDEECKKVFPEGSFRVVYRRGHKNLKEFLAPSGINDIYQQVKAKRVQQEGRCVQCGKCGSNPRGRKRDINLNNCSVLREGTHFSSNNTRENSGELRPGSRPSSFAYVKTTSISVHSCSE